MVISKNEDITFIINRNAFPILEFDDDKNAKINPSSREYMELIYQ